MPDTDSTSPAAPLDPMAMAEGTGAREAASWQALEGHLLPLLQDGERCLVSRDRDTIAVTVPDHDTLGRSPLCYTHPTLYGTLLAVEHRLARAMSLTPYLLWGTVAAIGIALIDTGLFGAASGSDAIGVARNGWIYAGWTLALLFVGRWQSERAVRSTWRRLRSQTTEAIAKAGFSLAETATYLVGDDAVRLVRESIAGEQTA